jgi:sigma-B regulation protein RsbU (phosphoserine phosphatase)
MVCTACCFDLLVAPDQQAVQLRYVNAAHPGLLLVRGEEVRELYQDGPFLGLRPDIDLLPMETTVQRGDVLLAFSDGLCDQPNAQGLTFPLSDTAPQAVRAGGAMQDVLERIQTAFDAFRGSRPSGDDITLIGVRLT